MTEREKLVSPAARVKKMFAASVMNVIHASHGIYEHHLEAAQENYWPVCLCIN